MGKNFNELSRQDAIDKIEHLDKIIHNQREKLWKLSVKRQNLYKYLFDFEGKFIRYEGFGEPLYMFVKDIVKTNDELIIRGYGFRYFYSEYDDCNYATYDSFEEITITKIQLERIDDTLKKFKIITKEEYITEFKEGLYDKLYYNVIGRIEDIE